MDAHPTPDPFSQIPDWADEALKNKDAFDQAELDTLRTVLMGLLSEVRPNTRYCEKTKERYGTGFARGRRRKKRIDAGIPRKRKDIHDWNLVFDFGGIISWNENNCCFKDP